MKKLARLGAALLFSLAMWLAIGAAAWWMLA
jgi:hypothetical protein